MNSGASPNRYRGFALVTTLTGAILSVALMLMSGLRPPAFLVFLFILWVIAPFAALGVVEYLFFRSQRFHALLIRLPIVLTLSSIIVYTYVLIRPLASQPAFPYVILPPIQLAVVAGFVLLALFRRSARTFPPD